MLVRRNQHVNKIPVCAHDCPNIGLYFGSNLPCLGLKFLTIYNLSELRRLQPSALLSARGTKSSWRLESYELYDTKIFMLVHVPKF